MSAHPDRATVQGVILAGGQARRMDGVDKGLVTLRDRPMVQWVLEALLPQVGSVVINANRNAERYGALGVAVIADSRDGYLGPLSGLSSALAQSPPEAAWTMMVPCDSPFVPPFLVERLLDTALKQQLEIVSCFDGERLQPVFSLVHSTLKPSLDSFLDAGERKIDRWFEQHRHATCDFSDVPRTFININTEQEREQIENELVDAG